MIGFLFGNLSTDSIARLILLVWYFWKQSKMCFKELAGKDAVDSPKNGFIFTTPKPKQNLSVRDVLSIADDEVGTAPLLNEYVSKKITSDHIVIN